MQNFLSFCHHLAFCNPKGGLCYRAGKVVDFYAIELIDRDLDGVSKFTDHAIARINAKDEPVVFMLWGRDARNKAAMLDRSKHLVLEAPHPSPLSAYSGFFGCRHFSKANEFLSRNGIAPINWQIENIYGN